MSYSMAYRGYQAPVGANILELCFALEHALKIPAIEQVSPDGRAAFEKTGTLNYYAFKGTLPVPVSDLTKQLTEWGFTFEAPKEDVSNLYGCPVYRITITDNPTSSIVLAPNMSVANANFSILLRVLDLPLNKAGWWEAKLLKERLSCIGSSAMVANARQGSVAKTGNLTIHDIGCDYDRISGYLERLEECVDYALAHGYNELYLV